MSGYDQMKSPPPDAPMPVMAGGYQQHYPPLPQDQHHPPPTELPAGSGGDPDGKGKKEDTDSIPDAGNINVDHLNVRATFKFLSQQL